MSPISVASVASYLNIDRSYFYKIFVKNIGISPQQYLAEFRMKRAKELLQRGVSVTETAQAVGMSSIYTFSALFKKIYGVPPCHFMGKEL